MGFKILYAGFETCFGWGGKTHLKSRCCAILIYIVCLLYDGNCIEWRGLKENEIKGGSKKVSVQSQLVRFDCSEGRGLIARRVVV